MTIARISKKRLAKLNGKQPFSSITASRKAPRKRKRKPSETLRIYGPKGYVEWIHEQPCIACGIVGFSEVAHTKTGGTGRKADWTDSIPLCGNHPEPLDFGVMVSGCHKAFHAWGKKTFELVYDIDLEDAAIAIQERWRAWQDHLNGDPK